MKDPKLKSVYVCTNCGEVSPRWMGKCPSCGSWNTMVEDVVAPEPAAGLKGAAARPEGITSITASRLSEVSTTEEKSRILTGISELDRVLGGGIVLGGVVLLSGEPGVGKSTMLLQLCGAISRQHSVLYVTGEESVRQVKLRATRLDVPQENIFLAAETNVDEICGLIEKTKPDLVVIDSIQTMRCTDISSSAGTVSQVKESTARLLAVAKSKEIPTFIVGHVNKDGAIAGPKVMEHIVDTVLYFEGDKMLPYRILRAAKNRYGSTNEIGMFDMTGKGLAEIENPSQQLLEGRPLGVSGNCVACTIEGTRPILSEIQALATKTNFPAPRRTCSGYDYNRMNLLLAVLEKRAGYFFGNLDVYVNIVGGLNLKETSCDLPVCLSMVSSLLDHPIGDKVIAIGEVGLGGEVRSVPNLELRLKEAERIGFETAIIPKHSLSHLDTKDYPNLHLIGAAYVQDAIRAIR
jgi:DNA repair protein RadA/Sms